jgi:EmrB/QacA subfamily drug resistance transporter
VIGGPRPTDAGEINAPAVPEYPRSIDPLESTGRKWIVLGALGFSSLLAAIGNNAVSPILPILQRDFGTDIATIGLTLSVYQVVTASLLITFGRLGDLRGHRSVYLVGIGLFTVASGACSLAPSALFLIAARAVQAVGSAMLLSTNVAILLEVFTPRYYGRVLGLFSLATYVGLSSGPIVAGVLADAFGWRSIFLINLPTGTIMFLIASRFVPRRAHPTGDGRFDLQGAVTFALAFAALSVGLAYGSTWGWTSPLTVGAGVAATALFAAFVAIEAHLPGPMLDLHLFRDRGFSMATASAVLNYIGVSTIGFLIPYYLIHGRGIALTEAGLYLSVQPIAQVVAAPLSGALSDRIGTRLLSTAGMGLFTVGLGVLSFLGPETPMEVMLGGLVLCGLGTGAFISPNMSAMMRAAPVGRHGTASGVQATARYVGFALGVSIAAATVTTVVGGGQPVAASEELFLAIDIGFLVAATLTAAGTMTSALRAD